MEKNGSGEDHEADDEEFEDVLPLKESVDDKDKNQDKDNDKYKYIKKKTFKECFAVEGVGRKEHWRCSNYQLPTKSKK